MKTYEMPSHWIEQLETEGMMVVPVRGRWDALLLVTDGMDKGFAEVKYCSLADYEKGETVRLVEKP